MSAFVVQDHTINRIISYITQGRDSSRDSTWYAWLINDRLGKDIATDEGINELGCSMFALNVKAVEARYGKGEAAQFRELDYQFRFELPDRMTALKALSCWLYQCCEGVCDESELYKTMDYISGRIGIEIARSLPAWEAVPGDGDARPAEATSVVSLSQLVRQQSA